MGLIQLKKNEVIHRKGDTVQTLEILVKGKVAVSIDGY